MPANDTWPCSISTEPLVSMNSAGSCDSMVSINTDFSEDSMEHLSAEERACLMFLEETIESLETEDDSGISNDEPDGLSYRTSTKMATVSQNKMEEVPFNEDSNQVLGKDHKTHSLLVPSPLILANGSAKNAKKAAEVSTPGQQVPLFKETVDSASNSHHPPAIQADMPPSFIPEPPVKALSTNDSKSKHSPPKPRRDPMPDQKHMNASTEMLMELIPPPSDFMDEPVLPPPMQTQLPEQGWTQPQTQPQAQPKTQPQEQVEQQPQSQVHLHTQPHAQAQPKAQTQIQVQPLPQTPIQTQPIVQPQAQQNEQTQPQHQPQTSIQIQTPQSLEGLNINPPPGFERQVEDEKPQSTVTQSDRGLSPSELDKIRKKASLKRVPGLSPEVAVQQPGANVSDPSVSCTDGRTIAVAEYAELKNPPAVAPKPKKLPPNIVLKSHRDSWPGHSLVPSSDRMSSQKVHMEALKKLGLLKTDEIDSSTNLSSSPPCRIPPPHPYNSNTCAVPPIGDPAQVKSVLEDRHAVGEAHGRKDLPLLEPSNIGQRESLLIQRGQSLKISEIKSMQMERTGADLKSINADHSSPLINQNKSTVELSPGQLRRSRPRPASAGSQKDLDIDQLSPGPSRELDIRRSLGSSPIPPPVQPNSDSQKLPRSHGMISVVFSPHSKNGEDRKQALRKLGLIRD
ncbi:specifically androgen-regulated gene protein [Hoplias malabaricus]|uniref:specifically androgen-regulated gene protein n=1 Tax=Hoplias malabaricus TaxID=27720 RepID=UPI0034627B12